MPHTMTRMTMMPTMLVTTSKNESCPAASDSWTGLRAIAWSEFGQNGSERIESALAAWSAIGLCRGADGTHLETAADHQRLEILVTSLAARKHLEAQLR